MKMNLTKEWFRQRAALDDRAEVSAGMLDISTAWPPLGLPNVEMQRVIEAEEKKMRKLILALVLIASVGCHKVVTVPIPGQLNAFDGTAYRTLMDTQAAINSVKANVTSGQLVLTVSQKTVFNQIIADYNTANALWQTYHAGATQNTTALTSAINQLIVDISTLSTQFGGGK